MFYFNYRTTTSKPNQYVNLEKSYLPLMDQTVSVQGDHLTLSCLNLHH